MFGHVIRDARLAQTMSQKQAAAKLRISSQYLCDIEHCRRIPPGRLLGEFADVLHVDYDYLCYLIGILPADLCEHDVTPEEVSEAFHKMRLLLIGPEYTSEAVAW